MAVVQAAQEKHAGGVRLRIHTCICSPSLLSQQTLWTPSCAQVAVEQAAQEKHAGDVRLDVKDGPAGQDTKTNMKAEAKLEGGGPVKMEQD